MPQPPEGIIILLLRETIGAAKTSFRLGPIGEAAALLSLGFLVYILWTRRSFPYVLGFLALLCIRLVPRFFTSDTHGFALALQALFCLFLILESDFLSFLTALLLVNLEIVNSILVLPLISLHFKARRYGYGMLGLLVCGYFFTYTCQVVLADADPRATTFDFGFLLHLISGWAAWLVIMAFHLKGRVAIGGRLEAYLPMLMVIHGSFSLFLGQSAGLFSVPMASLGGYAVHLIWSEWTSKSRIAPAAFPLLLGLIGVATIQFPPVDVLRSCADLTRSFPGPL